MEKRLLLAFALAGVVIFLTNILFPPPPRQTAPVAADSAKATAPAARPAAAPPPSAARTDSAAPAQAAPARTVSVRSPLYRYDFTTAGAALVRAELLPFASYVYEGGRVQLVPRASQALRQRVVVGRDTIDFSRLAFTPSADRVDLRRGDRPRELRFTAAGPNGLGAEVVYTFRPDDYLVDVRGRVTGLRGPATLVTQVGTGLEPHDAPEHGSARELAAVAWNSEKIARLPLRKVAASDTLPGPLRWAGIKDRYFLMALLPQGGKAFQQVLVTDLPDEMYVVEGKGQQVSPRARVDASMPLGPDGAFAFQAYLGPQEHSRLAAVGHELEEVNPYGYVWLRPIIRPIAAVVLWLLKEMHDNLGLAYGWVLVVFGFLMRAVTWPLNAKAMRAQMKNMAVQPVLQARMAEAKKKYPTDPRKQQEAMMLAYQELGINPISMAGGGCLPLLIPFPVLITLFFVFQSAIEFRGTRFAWLPDLSLKDPWNILPLFLVASMFALQWISTKMSGIEQNAQMKMMMYFMPLMMGAIFWMMPSGLNLYYASTNVASVPQQLLISRERRRAMEKQKEEEKAKKAGGSKLRPSSTSAPQRRPGGKPGPGFGRPGMGPKKR